MRDAASLKTTLHLKRNSNIRLLHRLDTLATVYEGSIFQTLGINEQRASYLMDLLDRLIDSIKSPSEGLKKLLNDPQLTTTEMMLLAFGLGRSDNQGIQIFGVHLG